MLAAASSYDPKDYFGSSYDPRDYFGAMEFSIILFNENKICK